MVKLIQKLYAYRQLLKSNIRKEIRGKYKGSFLGVLWSFVNPLLMTLVYAIVFPFILKNSQEHYLTYLVIGILPWNFFTTVISQGTTTVLANAGIIKKVYFPREILPVSVATSGLVNFIISFPIILIFIFFSGIGFSWHIIFVPIIILTEYLLLLGIIFITSAIEVYVRDAEYIINFIINMVFYATPILYTADLFPARWSWIFKLNPMATIIECYRDVLFYHSMPHIKSLLIVLFACMVLLFIGLKILQNKKKGFAEEV